MTPEQVGLVTQSVVALRSRLAEVADDFYARLFERHPDLRAMFPAELTALRRKFADELELIVRAIPDFGGFVDRARGLGSRHVGYGVRAGHYTAVRPVLLEALAAALGDRWHDELAVAWHSAYDMITEVMLMGAVPAPPRIGS
ncbi:globin domain-containing protein [Acrocarpospora catenulata]|uniref:globin domain-containing protein n=1 Tax=Acrocarpospora catenulata TaxID=2836182 RepID=UPI001BDA94CE|nr:globin domain-containing protein [Acrocarpospora catenulata]